MAPNLTGLNIVHPEEPNNSGFDAQDLLSGPPFPDLDLWTHLPFDDVTANTAPGANAVKGDKDKGSPASEEEENVEDHHQSQPLAIGEQQPQFPPFDIAAFLTSAGLLPPLPQPQAPQQQPSLAQILAFAQHQQHQQAPVLPPLPQPAQQTTPTLASAADVQPASKRARSRKSSESTITSTSAASTSSPVVSSDTPVSASSPTTPASQTTPAQALSASEDKRRRNTAASARFRLKKKEREQALEVRAKELESRVGELERECEGLRRENGWLKGLVVGVTGGIGPAPQPPQTVQSTSSQGLKRPREDE